MNRRDFLGGVLAAPLLTLPLRRPEPICEFEMVNLYGTMPSEGRPKIVLHDNGYLANARINRIDTIVELDGDEGSTRCLLYNVWGDDLSEIPTLYLLDYGKLENASVYGLQICMIGHSTFCKNVYNHQVPMNSEQRPFSECEFAFTPPPYEYMSFMKKS